MRLRNDNRYTVEYEGFYVTGIVDISVYRPGGKLEVDEAYIEKVSLYEGGPDIQDYIKSEILDEMCNYLIDAVVNE